MEILQPATPDELAALLKKLAPTTPAIQTGGSFSKSTWGGPVGSCDVQISTIALNQLIQYEPNDLTISIGSGMRWKTLLEILSTNNQTIPLDPPYLDAATVGGVVAANSSGPRQRIYGSPRDHVIGMKFATLEGKLVESGGMVVKNVAGLDMSKLLIGSFGTLAVITSVNFKITPKAPYEQAFLYRADSAEAAIKERDRMLRGVLQPVAIDLLSPTAARRIDQDGFILAVQAAGNERVIERYRRELTAWEMVDGSKLWTGIREFIPAYLADNPQGAVARKIGLLSELRSFVESTNAPLVTRAGNGITFACFPDYGQASEWIKRTGNGIIQCAANHGAPDAQWPNPGQDLAVMQKVKNMFDPNRILNPGRLYGRI